MIRHFRTLLFCLCSAIVLAGCADNPSSVGNTIIPRDDILSTDTLVTTATAVRSYVAHRGGLSALSFYVGRTATMEASALLRFTSMSDTMTDAKILKAQLILSPNALVGDSSRPVSFNCYPVVDGWTASGFTVDSLVNLHYTRTIAGSYSGIVNDSDSISVDLPTDLIHTWFAEMADSQFVPGLLLKSTSQNGIIRGFESFSGTRMPLLYILAQKDTTIDTLYYYAGAGTSVFNVKQPSDLSQSVVVQTAAAFDAVIHFDVSGIPPRSIINGAFIELERNTQDTLYTRPVRDSVVAAFIIDSTMQQELSSSLFQTNGTPVSVRSGNQYRINVTEMIQRWVNGAPNYGLKIRAYNDQEYLGLQTFRFFDLRADKSLQPRLRIYYSRMK